MRFFNTSCTLSYDRTENTRLCKNSPKRVQISKVEVLKYFLNSYYLKTSIQNITKIYYTYLRLFKATDSDRRRIFRARGCRAIVSIVSSREFEQCILMICLH